MRRSAKWQKERSPRRDKGVTHACWELLEKRQLSAEAEFVTERDIEFDFTHAPYKHDDLSTVITFTSYGAES